MHALPLFSFFGVKGRDHYFSGIRVDRTMCQGKAKSLVTHSTQVSDGSERRSVPRFPIHLYPALTKAVYAEHPQRQSKQLLRTGRGVRIVHTGHTSCPTSHWCQARFTLC